VHREPYMCLQNTYVCAKPQGCSKVTACHHASVPPHQARRIAALSSLPNLHSLWLDPDLGPEALASLAKLPALRDLRLLGNSHSSHSGHSLQALCGLSQLTSLSFKWTAGR